MTVSIKESMQASKQLVHCSLHLTDDHFVAHLVCLSTPCHNRLSIYRHVFSTLHYRHCKPHTITYEFPHHSRLFHVKKFNNCPYFTIGGNVLLPSLYYYALKEVGVHESSGTKTQYWLTTFTKIPWKFHTFPLNDACIWSSVTLLLKHSS